jgi:anti-sigma regulatory factor (Ser/Thr protein kinase)
MTRSTSLLLGEVTEMSQLRGVRQALSVELHRLGLPEVLVDDASVMVSELAANALEHARRTAVVSLSWTDDEVRVSVFDASNDPPIPRPSDPSRAGGRGLMIVDAFADRHGVDPSPDGGKSVWFAIDRHRQP